MKNMLYCSYLDRLYKIALKNINKTSNQIKNEILIYRDGILEEIAKDNNYTAMEYMEVYNNKDKILNDIIEKIENEKIEKQEEEKRRKEIIKEDEEIRRAAIEELKEEEREIQENKIKIVCILAAVLYIIIILYTI